MTAMGAIYDHSAAKHVGLYRNNSRTAYDVNLIGYRLARLMRVVPDSNEAGNPVTL